MAGTHHRRARRPSGAAEVRDAERSLPALQGTERAVLASSMLHAFFDLIPILASDGMAIHLDRGAYPIPRWGVERAVGRGAAASSFRHHDPADLRRRLRRGLRPLVIVDGFCPGCGETAPVGEYLDAVRAGAGTLVLDDTQALGAGRASGLERSARRRRRGSLRVHHVGRPDIVVVSSLAKGFGVPMASVAGGQELVSRLEAETMTRVHASPLSLCHVQAGQRALAWNRDDGERLRTILTRRILQFRSLVDRLGIPVESGVFPVQTLVTPPGLDNARMHSGLLASGIRAVLHDPRCRPGVRVTFLITARHGPADIDRAVEALGAMLATAT